MKDKDQLFRALKNTEPRFDYHLEMKPIDFVEKNTEIIRAAEKRCEMTGIDFTDMIYIAKKLLVILPNKPYGSYIEKAQHSDPFWGQFGERGSKRHKRGTE